jgi:hypothetical protein
MRAQAERDAFLTKIGLPYGKRSYIIGKLVLMKGFFMQKPILLVLASGMGSRFGGLKQMEPVWKNGEALLEFSVFDAIRAGFGKAVFIIRRDFADDFKTIILDRISKAIPCELAFQEKDSLVPTDLAAVAAERVKPWGTAHSVACAAPLLDAPFAVINADDFYGRSAIEALGRHLSGGIGDGAIIPYRLADVLSDNGIVNRGRCEIKDGYLADVKEIYKIERTADGIRGFDLDGRQVKLDDDTPVSMNCWGFPAATKNLFIKYWNGFIRTEAGQKNECLLQDTVMRGIETDEIRVKILSAECVLPSAVMDFYKTSGMKIRTLEAGSNYFGMTYREDLQMVKERLAELVAFGEYPENLWA